MAKGKLIVFEGIDGSGKSCQYRHICQRLENDGIDYNHIVFPRYDKESSALIRMYLGGSFGSHPEDVNAYTASTFTRSTASRLTARRGAIYITRADLSSPTAIRPQTPSIRAASSVMRSCRRFSAGFMTLNM